MFQENLTDEEYKKLVGVILESQQGAAIIQSCVIFGLIVTIFIAIILWVIL